MEHTLQVAIAHHSTESLHTLHIAVAQLGLSVCVHAGTGRELIDAAQKPDLVIVQEFLPDMTGLEAVRQACGPTPVPIIVVIDRNDGRLLEQPNAENVLAALMEPVRSADLAAVIPLVLHRFEQLQALRESIALLKDAVEDDA